MRLRLNPGLAMDERFVRERSRMVEEQLKNRGIQDERVLRAFRDVPRHVFVPDEHQRHAYEDHPIGIGYGQTISQPYMVAVMVAALNLKGYERVLEIGTGSGYQSAILSKLVKEVFTIERISKIMISTDARLNRLGCHNVRVQVGDGTLGWSEHAPYQGIIVGAASPDIPKPLLDQLDELGNLVIPIGKQKAQLIRIQKRESKLYRENMTHCAFVPLIGRFGWSDI